jgi:Uma2 family endonuclease
MTTAQLEQAQKIASGDGRILLQGVSWALYEHMLQELGESHLFFTYDRGDLEIMSPSLRHDRRKSLLQRMVQTLTVELKLKIVSCGSTTCRREDLLHGIEPDECFYIANQAAVLEKEELDLSVDPPPDLAIEVDVTSSSIPRYPIFVALGVPELWRLTRSSFEILVLTPEKQYKPADSLSFPGLKASHINEFLKLHGKREENELIAAFAEWARQNMKSR